MMKHAFLIPTRNEEKAIRFVLGRIRDKFPGHCIIVADGHSTDNTLKIAGEFRGVEILRQKSQGKGGGILEALQTLDPDTCVTMFDGDGSYEPLDAAALMGRARPGTFVNGFRTNMDAGAMPKINFVGNRLINAYASLFLMRRIKDMLSGMKCFFVRDMRAIGLQSRDFMIETEMTVKSVRAGYEYVEMPIGYHSRIGESKLDDLKDGPKIVRYLTKELSMPSVYRATRVDKLDLMPIDRRTTPYFMSGASAIFWRRLDAALRVADFRGTESVLDIGSGSGIFIPSLAVRASGVAACDPDIKPARVRAMLEKYGAFRNVSIKKCSASQIKGKFDIVFCMDVLEHISDLDGMSGTIENLLGPSGRLIASLPTENGWYSLARSLSTRTKPKDHFWTADEVVSKLCKNGFTLEKKIEILEKAPQLFRVCAFKRS